MRQTISTGIPQMRFRTSANAAPVQLDGGEDAGGVRGPDEGFGIATLLSWTPILPLVAPQRRPACSRASAEKHQWDG
jgi:hypothetical protein